MHGCSSFIYFKRTGLRENKKGTATSEAIGLDSREVHLPLFLKQKLMIVQVITKQRKQQCFETLIKTPIYSPLTYDIP